MPDGTALALLVQLELHPANDAARAFEQIQESLGRPTPGQRARRDSADCSTAAACSKRPSWRFLAIAAATPNCWRFAKLSPPA